MKIKMLSARRKVQKRQLLHVIYMILRREKYLLQLKLIQASCILLKEYNKKQKILEMVNQYKVEQVEMHHQHATQLVKL